MKKTLKVCSVLLALSLVLFSCKTPDAPKYVEYSPSDLTVTNKATGSRKAVTANTSDAKKTELYNKITTELESTDPSCELTKTNTAYAQAVDKRNQLSNKYEDKLINSYTSTYTPGTYDIPNGKYTINKDVQTASRDSTKNGKYEESYIETNTKFSKTFAASNVTKSVLMSNDSYNKIKKSITIIDSIPSMDVELKMKQSSSGILYFDDGEYAGYVKTIIYYYINGTNVYNAIFDAMKKQNQLSQDLSNFFSNVTKEPSQDVIDFLNPLLEKNTEITTCIVVYDNDGKNPYTYINETKSITYKDLAQF